MSVEEIGHIVGYEDPTFFRRLFKRKVGLTLAAYRRKFSKITAMGHSGTQYSIPTSAARFRMTVHGINLPATMGRPRNPLAWVGPREADDDSFLLTGSADRGEDAAS